MRLKSLQIKGFKSFANDTLLNFNENVIGVVGPNGSGKSNIVDAIRWVLGEQKSKDLRLESMSDVIFNGTKTKKEAATASVSLTFDNTKNILPTEYQTVTISRTLYRSGGESEYRLNNIICRLKDINSLFLDTGIGSNSYAIIALGMVDDILEDKDNARRKMFEQAAGISKYKVRKRETLQKLKSATEDLNRIDDLLFEIEGNLKSLEKQARRTQKYLDIKTEYKDLSIKHAIASIKNLKNGYKDISDQLVKDQDAYRVNDAQLYTWEASLEKDKKANADKEMALSEHQKKLNNIVHQIRSKEGEKGLLAQKISFKKQNKDQLSTSLTSFESALITNVQDLTNLTARLENENVILSALSQSYSTSKTEYDAIKLEYNEAKLSFDMVQKEKQALNFQVFDIEKNVAIQKNNLDNIHNENGRLQEQLTVRSAENIKIENDHLQLNKSLEIKEKELQNILLNEDERKKQIVGLESSKDELKDKLSNINRSIDSKQNELQLLKDMIDNFEGFPESAKYLHDQWKKDLLTLSDIVDVNEEYKATVELYLDHYLNYYIVDNFNTAKQGIQLLKNAQKGRANFFMLDQIEPKKLTEFPGSNTLTKVIDILHTDQKYKNLIDHMLGNVYLYDGDLDGFNMDVPHDITILSASGTFQKKNLTLSGGSVGLFEGKKLGRKQNVEKLSSEITKKSQIKIELTTQLKDIHAEIDKLKSTDFLKIIDVYRKDVRQMEQDKIRLQHIIQSFLTLKTEHESKLKVAGAQLSDINKIIETEEKKIKDLKQKISNLTSLDPNNNNNLDVLNEKLTKISEKYNNDNISLIRHQNLISNLQKDKDFSDQKIKELETRIENDRLKMLSEERERIDIEDQIIILDRELQSLYTERQNFQSTMGEAEQDYFKAKGSITNLEDQIKNLVKNQAILQHNIQNSKDKYADQKFQIQSISERLRIEFSISVNDYINDENYNDETLNNTSLAEDLEKMRSRLNSFGDVNPLAVEAYNEMKIRFDNINVQRKDILEAKDSLMDTMKEIETTATNKFMLAFEQVRENFISVFRNLFTKDDTCDLVLMDPENPLDSDIEIIAKPKGKKPRSLSQLSGGEKTLTATALLFALYLLKPAPFCIFDEVDAPLDDANVQKFSKIIKNFSSQSQFIIVTHNKSTMAEVDVLYGIYMSEPGVSSISPVDFRSLKHEPTFENLS